ncbi:MAG: hypothetical protein ACK5NT_13720 [Pyrinomonadaceae bacterium]
MGKYFNPLIAAIVFAGTVIGFVYFVVYYNGNEESLTEKAQKLKQMEIPDLSLKEISTGEYTKGFNHGEVILIYMVSTCDACKKELRLL